MTTIEKLIQLQKTGMSRFVGPPQYGSQDLGICPGGAMDFFSMQTGNVLLDNQKNEHGLEIGLLAPKIEFKETCLAVLCGAQRKATLQANNELIDLEHGKVYQVHKKSILTFGKLSYGLHTYLCVKKGNGASNQSSPQTFFSHRAMG